MQILKLGIVTWQHCCVCVCFPYSGTSRNQAYKQQYQRVQRDTDMKYKKGFFFKALRSEVMSTLLRKPIATVSLHRQRHSGPVEDSERVICTGS